MRIGILCEATARPGDDLAGLYQEVMELIEAAEVSGFDFFGCSEQHFWPTVDGIPSIATIATPEIFYAMGIARTSRIGFRSSVATLSYHHPLILASRMATLDIVSGGRFEFGTGRGNSTLAADAFQIPVTEMHERWRECLEIILAAWSSGEEFSWQGKHYDIPARPISVRPLQQPYPPIYYAAFSPDSFKLAGEMGLGLMTATAGVTFDKLQGRVGIYRDAIAEAKAAGTPTREAVSLTFLGHCAPSNEDAAAEGVDAFQGYLISATAVYQEMVGRLRPDVDFRNLRDRYTFDYMNDNMMIVCGDPAAWLERLKVFADAGIEEFIVNFVGVPHDAILRAVKLLGEEVLPTVHSWNP
ncbi:MAG TPA: LLM class flavin-dependent oxidoreductase [Mycobacteriales bacterium]|nr:LLM class flavin-dependent oxidoreductase [Mycobacteriales bacterium]